MSEKDPRIDQPKALPVPSPEFAPVHRHRGEVQKDTASYILIEEQDFTALIEHQEGQKKHNFINPKLREAFNCKANCVIAVPLYIAKGGPKWEKEQGAAFPQQFLRDENIVTFQGEKVLLYTLVFTEKDSYEFTQLTQSNFTTLLHAIETEARKAAGGGVFGRRAALAALLLGAVGLGAATMRYISSRQLHDLLAKDAPALPPAAPPASLTSETRETPENIKNLPGLAAVLASSLQHFEPGNRTLRDPLLKPNAVSEAFLDNRFRYTGQAQKPKEANSPYKDQRIHTFTVIGSRSSYYNAQGHDRFDDTYLNHAINTLLDVKNLSDEEIKEWIVFNYQRAFSVTLEASRITLTRSSKTQEVSYVTYNPPAGFENRMRINYARSVEDESPFSPGGNVTVDEKSVPILASDNRLMLQSGISPDHDLQVPESLLDLDKECTRPLGKDGSFGTIEITATELAQAIHRYHEILDQKLDISIFPHSTDGMQHQMQLCSPFVDQNDSIVRKVGRQLLPKGANAKQATQIFTGFVQGTPYRRENAADYNRPAACTIFNNGSDCNGLLILWANLNTTCKIPHAIFYFVDNDGKSRKAHVTGGVHEKLIPTPEEIAEANLILQNLGILPVNRPQLSVPTPDRKTRFYNQELTAGGFAPGDNAFPAGVAGRPEMEIVAVEYVSFPQTSSEPKIHVSTRGKR